MVVEEVEESEVPPDRLTIKHRVEEYLEQKADMNVHWAITHLEDCSFLYYYQRMPDFCQVMNIRVGSFTIRINKPNGAAWIETVPIRIPDDGDPPAPGSA